MVAQESNFIQVSKPQLVKKYSMVPKIHNLKIQHFNLCTGSKSVRFQQKKFQKSHPFKLVIVKIPNVT